MTIEVLKDNQQRLVRHVSNKKKRFLYQEIRMDEQLVGIMGPRGTGKTTLMLQKAAIQDKNTLYLSADHFIVVKTGLYSICDDFLKSGGKTLFIDEIHTATDWPIIIKSLYDSHPDANLCISGSSMLALQLGQADLSRRLILKKLPGLSLREFLDFRQNRIYPPIAFEDLFKQDHALEYAQMVLADGEILGSFQEYIQYGLYPFFLEGLENFYAKLEGIINRVLYKDIFHAAGIRPAAVNVMKQILWEVATASPYQLRPTRLAGDLGVTKLTLYSYLEYLEMAGLLHVVIPKGSGATITRGQRKAYLDNTCLMEAITQGLRQQPEIGTLRETFFVHQLLASNKSLRLPKKGDFLIDDQLIEIGGRRKSRKQIYHDPNSIVVADGIELPGLKKIPLWMFGMLY
jgi:predicted AAA+ superfamily ATPase